MKIIKSSLGMFIIKRMLVLFSLLALLDVIFLRHRWMVLAGLSIGSIVSLVRFSTTSEVCQNLLVHKSCKTDSLKGVFKYIFSQIFTILIMVVSIIQDKWLFIGLTAGILIVPAIVIINGITEGLSITKNNFE